MNTDLQLFLLLLPFPLFLIIWGVFLLVLKIKFIRKAKKATAEVTGYVPAPKYPLFLCYFLVLSFVDDKEIKRVFNSNLSYGFERFAKAIIGRKYKIYYTNEDKFRAETKKLIFCNSIFLISFGILSGILLYIIISPKL